MAILAQAAGHVTMIGSDTAVRQGQRWAEEYMKHHSGTVIQVSGGGSSAGIAALINGTTDICQSSREMSAEEVRLAEQKGIEPYRVTVALDGIAIYLHKDNPVAALSLGQLKDIYTRTITNWRAVGGEDHQIILYGRENSSGTYAFFRQRVLVGEDFAPEVEDLAGTSAVIHAVANDPYGIGYGGIAWHAGIKHAAIRFQDNSEAVSPNAKTVTDGIYPISRQLYWYFNGAPTGETKEFTNWVLSPKGQEMAEKSGFIPLPKEMAERTMIP